MNGFKFFFVLASLAGILVASYLLVHHYRVRYRPEHKSFCNISKEINCDAVALHPTSELIGVPVAAYGVLAYAALLFMTLNLNDEARRKRLSCPLLLGMSVVSAYLAFVSKIVIGSWCILCISSYIISWSLLVAAILQYGTREFVASLAGFIEEIRVK